jgi:type IV pilus assembly protein PilC
MTRAAEAMERRRVLIFTLLTALTYPAIVVIAAIGVASFMVVSVVPKLARFLASLGRRLPAMTQFLVDLSLWVEKYGLYLLIGIAVAIVTFFVVRAWPPGRMQMDRAYLRIPIIGKLIRLANTALFARNLGVLLRSGITLVEGLRTVETLHRNRYVAQQVAAARGTVLGGGRLADPLAERAVFMPMLSRMVAIGEASGTLDDILEEVAKFHESQLQSSIRQLSVLIEPAIIVVVGVIVGFVYISFFVALFSAAGGAR